MAERHIEQHIDNTINLAVCRSAFANTDAEPAGYGGSNCRLIEMLAFDRAGLEHIFSERRNAAFVCNGKPSEPIRPIS